MASTPPTSFSTSLPAGAMPTARDHHDAGLADAATCTDRRLCPLQQPQENRLMERTQLFDLMGELKLYGMKPPMIRSRPPPSNASMSLSALSATCSTRRSARSMRARSAISSQPPIPDAPGLHRPRRTLLSAVRPGCRPAPVLPGQAPLPTRLCATLSTECPTKTTIESGPGAMNLVRLPLDVLATASSSIFEGIIAA